MMLGDRFTPGAGRSSIFAPVFPGAVNSARLNRELKQIAAFCRLTGGLMDYIDHYEPGHRFYEDVK